MSSQQPLSSSEEHTYTAALLAGDVLTSVAVGVAVAAPVTIIDYSIMMKVSGVSPSLMRGLSDGFKILLTKPHQFFFKHSGNQYALIYKVVATVYAMTYLTSNITKHSMEERGYSANEVNVGRGVVTGVSNTLLTMWKDSFILARLPAARGAAAGAAFVPMVSRLGFCVRDIITCVAAFTLAPMFTNYLCTQYNGDAVPSLATNSTISAITVPASMQIFTTALHIGCIRYQRTYPNPSWLDIKTSLRADYLGSMAARIGRIIPAFGIGSIGNARLLDFTTQWARDVDRKRAAQVQSIPTNGTR